MGLGKKGNVEELGDLSKPFFRSSRDYGFSQDRVSEKWDVWRMNEPSVYIGKLEGENTKADIGFVTWPDDIIDRMQTGEYSSFYPDYK